MKILSIFLITIIFAAAAALAQSGRVKTASSQVPVSDPPDDAVYSETGVYVRRRLYEPENLGKSKKRKNKESEKKRSNARSKSDSADAENDSDPDIITIDSTFVMIPVAVYDRDGLYVPNLKKGNFAIFEDGEEQEIAYFATSEKPFTVVLLLDTSPSTIYRIEEIQEAAKAFVDQLKPEDQVIVIEFDQNVHVLTEATTNRKKIYKAIDKADFGNGTSLYDAIEFVIEKRLSKIEGKKAIVLFTDGVDTTSRGADYYENIDEVEESDVTIYPIYYNTFRETVQRSISADPEGRNTNQALTKGLRAIDYAIGRQYLLELAGSTGGQLFIPENTNDGLRNAFRGIAEELSRQYDLGYYPINEGSPGTRKRIKVRVNRPKLIVRNRDSYVVGDTKR